MTSLPPLAERIATVQNRIAEACRQNGRDPAGVRLVAVSKTRPPEAIEAAAALGLRDFGENRIQEAAAKLPQVRAPITPHLIGHLQSNKARRAVGLFEVIQSVDSVKIGRRLSGMIARGVQSPGGESIRILAQADLAGEASKTGIPEARLEPVLAALRPLPGLELTGLMLIPPFLPDPEAVRPWFARLRRLGDQFATAGLLPPRPELSMGMSHDYAAAIAEGATIVRVGTAIFGPRPS